MFRRRLVIAAVLSLATSSLFALPKEIRHAGEPVKGEYLVRLSQDAGDIHVIGARLAQMYGGKALLFFRDINTMLVRMNEGQAEALSREPLVDTIEENAIGHLATMTSPQTGLDSPRVANSPASSWGLDHTDRSAGAPRLDDLYRWVYDGTGTQIYVVDTGVLPYHPEFGNWPNTRVQFRDGLANTLAALAPPDQLLRGQCWEGGSPSGFSANAAHGTAVASIAAGETLGMAKGATIVDARTVACNGSWTTARLIVTLDWIKSDPARIPGAAVINLSLNALTAAPPDSALQAKIQSIQNDAVDPIPIVISAGNNGSPAQYSPGNIGGAIVVGGIRQFADMMWIYSNYGDPVSVYAPAEHIESATNCMQNVYDSQGHLVYYCALYGGLTRPIFRSELTDCTNFGDAYGCTSGTSFAAAHVSGGVARQLQVWAPSRRLSAADLNYEFFARAIAQIFEPPTGRYVPAFNYRDGRF
jgi:hypothetical protein